MSLIAAELGHLVTALDLSAGMLERLRGKAASRGMEVQIVHGPADEPPPGPFDAVIERHLLWTVPEPGAALSAWHRAAPEGRLILFEGIMPGREHVRRARGWAADRVRRAAGVPHDHHAEYDPDILDLLPLARLSSPAPLIHSRSRPPGWGRVRLERLRDIEWARGMAGAEGVAQRLQGWQQYVLVPRPDPCQLGCRVRRAPRAPSCRSASRTRRSRPARPADQVLCRNHSRAPGSTGAPRSPADRRAAIASRMATLVCE